MPLVLLCGERGVGKSALARRFIRATQRSVACDLVAERLGELDAERAKRDRIAREQPETWAARMVRDHGSCQAHCSPASWISNTTLTTILEQAQDVDPATVLEVSTRPDRDMRFLASPAWSSPGNKLNDPIRRTSLAFLEHADRLVGLNKVKRRACLDEMESFDQHIGHRVTRVFIGTPELAEALDECGTIQVIPLRAIPLDDTFAHVAGMVFGTVTSADLASLHQATGGVMGRLLHLAALRGLKPPFAIRDEEMLRLPAPPGD